MNAKVTELMETIGISRQAEIEIVAMDMNSAREEKRVPVETWSRVCGFFRPVSNFNLGKQEDSASAKHTRSRRNGNEKFQARDGML